MRPTKKWLVLGILGGAGIAGGAALSVGVFSGARPQRGPSVPHFRTVDRDMFRTSVAKMSGGAESEKTDGPAQEAYDNLAYPAASIAAAQQQAALYAANALGRLPGGKKTNWQEVGPSGVPASALVASESTGASAATVYSGRTTAIALSPDCHANNCKVFIGAAGGGVWEADNALASQPNWHPSGNGIPSNAIGWIVFDPNDPQVKTLYVGTGEPNGSSDSEAGVGLYKSTDSGQSWALVAGSTASTAPCASGVGRAPWPPGARSAPSRSIRPKKSHLYWHHCRPARLVFSEWRPLHAARRREGRPLRVHRRRGDVLACGDPRAGRRQPGVATGADFFRGGASDVELYRASGETEVYASFFDYGIYRRSQTRDGDSAFHQVFGSQGAGSRGPLVDFPHRVLARAERLQPAHLRRRRWG